MDIVLVEDDAGMRRAITRMLEASGHRVRAYESAEALTDPGVDRALPCDCFVLDIRLPGISGINLCRNLRAQASSRPCILITGHDEQGLRECAALAGASGYLPKPFSGEALLAAIERAMAAQS
ncbi:MAG: response regulator transcription factor [Rhodanobacteraceae bacterium]